jgi:hypothetical protein
MKMKMNKIVWYLKQLLPLTYRTTYVQGDKKHFTVWKMWFGRSYDINDYVIIGEENEPSEHLVDAVFKRINEKLSEGLRKRGVEVDSE